VSSLPKDGPPLAPGRNVGVTFLTSLLPLTDLIYRGAVRPVALVGHHEWQPACGPVLPRGLSYLKAVRSVRVPEKINAHVQCHSLQLPALRSVISAGSG
jgi:hypothetical protein